MLSKNSIKINFKKVWLWLAAIPLLVLLFLAGAVIYDAAASPVFVNKDVRLENKLAVPSVLEPEVSGNGTKIFKLTLQEGETEFFNGVKTKTWGANGNYLMPTIRANEDDNVEMHVTNTLNTDTTLHWHGMHLPATMDGVHQIIDPEETWKPHWQIRQQAATLWYHPHLMGRTGPHVYNGLAGMFIIDDDNSANLDLPKEYGVNDIPVIVQDRDFDENGQFMYEEGMAETFGPPVSLGDTILVNGTVGPYMDVPAGMVRLRILNGSNARQYNFGFDDDRTFYQIASDGGFLEAPVERSRLPLTPGERAEIVVDVSDGQNARLMSYAVVDNEDILRSALERISGNDADENEVFTILELRPDSSQESPASLPDMLNKIPRFDEQEASRTRQFKLGTHTINDKRMAIDRIDEIVELGTKEIWAISNPSGILHPFHIHDVQFQILDRNGEPPEAHERGWKDTVRVDPNETVRVMMEFKDYANPNVAYMFHCHILEHEDAGMMGQFVVVEPDTLPSEIKIRSEALDKGIIHGHENSGH